MNGAASFALSKMRRLSEDAKTVGYLLHSYDKAATQTVRGRMLDKIVGAGLKVNRQCMLARGI